MADTTQAQVGYGVRFKRGTDSSPQTFADIGQIIELSGPGFTRDIVDASHSLSPNRWKEFIAAMRDGGEIGVKVNLVPGAQSTDLYKKLVDDFNNNSPVEYRMVWPNTAATYWQFNAFLKDMPHDTPIEDRMTLDLSFKVTGEPALADGGS